MQTCGHADMQEKNQELHCKQIDRNKTMNIGIPKETFPGETRVAITPANVAQFKKIGAEVVIEENAGLAAGYLNSAYEEKGAKISKNRGELISGSDVVLQVRTLGANKERGLADLSFFKPGLWVMGHSEPLTELEAVQELAKTKVTSFSLELIPRITRAQSMDVLSSMATIAGYKGVILAAEYLPKIFPMYMTAAGTISPAQVFVIGAGVAGLQAIATAKRLGARVEAYDVRSAVKDQIESLGAKFVEMELSSDNAEDKGGYAKAQGEDFYQKQRELMAKVVARSDVVITTAAIPGKKSPILVTQDMVQGMKEGSVIVDLASERGGNCELTRAGETVRAHGVTILGPLNLAASVPYHASQLYGKNIATFLLNMIKDGKQHLDATDEIVYATLVTQGGEIVQPQIRELMHLPPLGSKN
jgi:NAD(P) transhydrogenase subunit alpha